MTARAAPSCHLCDDSANPEQPSTPSRRRGPCQLRLVASASGARSWSGSSVDRAKRLYQNLGWRLDADFATGDDFRVVQLTPTGSQASVIFGTGITTAAPGSADSLLLVVRDIDAARADLVSRGVNVSEVFHAKGGVFHHAGTEARVTGPDPERRSYASFASFSEANWMGPAQLIVRMSSLVLTVSPCSCPPKLRQSPAES